ncbi:MAG: hypothetical protein ACTHLE_09225 [Agriterribacter sp.]
MKFSILRLFALVSVRNLLAKCLVFVLVFASCKKESKPAAELIPGKWNVTSQYYYIHVGGRNSTQPVETAAGSYYEFKSDGKVMIQISESGPLEYDYSFQSDKVILFSKPGVPTKALTVMSINSSKLTLVDRVSASNGDYSEARIEMAK